LRRRFLGNIREQAERLGRVADRLLDLARLEQRQVLSESERIEMAGLVGAVIEAARPVAAQRDIVVELRAETSPQVQRDRFLLSQALGNLLDNALDFSPTGGRVEIQIDCVDDQAEVSIRDQGPGIPDYAAGRVFERFFSLPRPENGRKGAELDLEAGTDFKRRGLFKVLVYGLSGTIQGRFELPAELPVERKAEDSRITWDEPFLSLGLTDTRGLSRAPSLQWDGAEREFAQGTELGASLPNGLHAKLPRIEPGRARTIPFGIDLGLRGTESVSFEPLAATTRVALASGGGVATGVYGVPFRNSS